MTTNPASKTLNKHCERSITKMSDAQALAYIDKLIDDSLRRILRAGVKRTLSLLDELSKRELAETDRALIESFRASAWAARSPIASVRRSWS